MDKAKQIIVIGGGPAGIEAAIVAVRLGAIVTLVSDHPIGGRANWDSLLPSKVWLSAADRAGIITSMGDWGWKPETSGLTFDPSILLEKLGVIKNAWSEVQESELNRLGVEIVHGSATFVSGNSVDITMSENKIRRTADFIIVASGSVPVFPNDLKPDGHRVIAPRFASHLAQLPQTAVVIGGGPTGCEFAYLFNRLGTQVSWIVDSFGVLPMFQPEAGRFLAKALTEQGITLIHGKTATGIARAEDHVAVDLDNGDQIVAELAFVAIGRKPDWERLNLPAAGLEPLSGKIPINEYGQTNNPSVYLVGDAAGGWMVANNASQQAVIAVKHALGVPVPPYDPKQVMLAVYTEPQVAQIGELSGDALARVRVQYTECLKGYLMPESDGFVEIAYFTDDRRIAGGLAVGHHAADILALLAVAINAGLTIDDMASIYVAHPVFSELIFLAARKAGR